MQDNTLPNEFLCPITQEMMIDPVFCCDGHTYERSAIQKWFDTPSKRSPLSNAVLDNTTLIPNHALKKMISRHRSTISKKLLELCKTGPSNINTAQLEELMEQGAQLDTRDQNGNTSMMLLLDNDLPGCIKALARLGASLTCRNDQGLTVLELARCKVPRDETIVTMLYKLELQEKKEKEKRKTEEANRRKLEQEQEQEQQRRDGGNNRWQNWMNGLRFWTRNNNNNDNNNNNNAAAAGGDGGGGGGINLAGGGSMFGSFFFFGGFGGGMWTMIPMVLMFLYAIYNNPWIFTRFNETSAINKGVVLSGAMVVAAMVWVQIYKETYV